MVAAPEREQPDYPPPELVEWTSIDLSFYVCTGAPPGYQDGYCGGMAGGKTVYEGAVACGYAWPLGARIEIEGDPSGRVYICEDRGHGPYYWLDVFFWDYGSGRAWRNAIGYGAIRARVIRADD